MKSFFFILIKNLLRLDKSSLVISMSGWFDEWSSERPSERMDGWMDGWANEWWDKRMIEWRDEWMVGWMNEWLNGRIVEWLNRWIIEKQIKHTPFFYFCLQQEKMDFPISVAQINRLQFHGINLNISRELFWRYRQNEFESMQ